MAERLYKELTKKTERGNYIDWREGEKHTSGEVIETRDQMDRFKHKRKGNGEDLK